MKRYNTRFFFHLTFFLLHSIDDRISIHSFYTHDNTWNREWRAKLKNSIDNQQAPLYRYGNSFNESNCKFNWENGVVRLSFLCKCDRYRICRLSLITYRIFNRNTLVCTIVVVGVQEFPGIESRCNIRQVPQKFPGESLFEHVNITPSPPSFPINYFTHPRLSSNPSSDISKRKNEKRHWVSNLNLSNTNPFYNFPYNSNFNNADWFRRKRKSKRNKIISLVYDKFIYI